MIKVTVTDSSGRERIVEADSSPKVLGRGEDSDIVLGSRSITRHHLKIWDEGGKCMVEDLTGGTGITLDGEEISGTFELEPGADMEAGVFIFNIPGGRPKTSLDGESLEEAPIPMLHGTKGPTKGLDIELQEGDNDVGRDPSLYLVIDDASVSRQHARITVEAGRFSLVDMRSSNGTFVNSRRIETQDLRSGDIVRFGNLEFKFRYGVEVSKGAKALKRKKMLMIIGGGGLIVILLIAVMVKMVGGSKETVRRPDPVDSGPPIEVQVEQLKTRAQGAMESGHWKDAVKHLDAAIDLHPICRECKQLKNRVEAEIANKEVFDECVVDYDLNRWRKAMDCFLSLPKASFYEKKSKYKISECNKRLSAYHLGEGKGYLNARRFLQAHQNFVAYMKLKPCDTKVYNKFLKKTEKRLRANYIKKGWSPYDLDCEGTGLPQGEDPEEILKNLYRDPKIQKAMLLYFKGSAEPAIRELQRIVALERDQGRVEKARDVIREIRVVNGKFSNGQTLIYQGKIKQARDMFDQAMLVDRRLMPKGVTSFFREEVGKLLANKLHKEALGLFSRKHYLEASQLWKECLDRNPDATQCKSGMSMLEGIASDALDFARAKENAGDLKRAVEILKHIVEITPSDSMSHRKAKVWLNKIEEQ